jgi:hypothetical protein
MDRWPGAEEWNDALFETIMARRAGQAGVTFSNVHGWQSQTDMLEWGGEAAQRLIEHVLGWCDAHTVDVAEQDRRRFVWLPEMWANVNERGASNQTHCHPGSQWSAVYYVQDGYGGSDDPDLGGAGLFYDLAVRRIEDRSRRLTALAVLLAVVAAVWAQGAVGIF